MQEKRNYFFDCYGIHAIEPSNKPQCTTNNNQSLMQTDLPVSKHSRKANQRQTSQCSTHSLSSRKGIQLSCKFKKQFGQLYGNEVRSSETNKKQNIHFDSKRKDRREVRSEAKVKFQYKKHEKIEFRTCTAPQKKLKNCQKVRLNIKYTSPSRQQVKIYAKPWNQPFKLLIRSDSCKFFNYSSTTEETQAFEEETKKSFIEQLTALEQDIRIMSCTQRVRAINNYYGI